MKAFVTLLTGLSLMAAVTCADASTQVQLLKANSIVVETDNNYQFPRFDVLVQNLAYAKQVYIHMTTYNGTWIDLPLSYSRPAANGYEVWSGIYDQVAGPVWNVQFDVKYIVNGQTYWDNNNGANYSLAANSGTLLVGAMVYNEWNSWYNPYQSNYPIYANGGIYNGSVTLANVGPTKLVNVVYTTDGWKTNHTVAATYSSKFWPGGPFPGGADYPGGPYAGAPNPNSYGFEDWAFSFPVGSASQIQYAISYTVNGQTYWDNNFGNNYVVNIITSP